MSDLLQHVIASGFPWQDRLLHLFVGGSNLHGAKVSDGLDDLDIYGVYIEPPEWALGLTRPAPWKSAALSDSVENFCWSTAENSRKNVAGDVDVTLYALSKWARLASTGNPTALHFVFAKSEIDHPLWSAIVRDRSLFLSRKAAKHFIGFADDQLKRLTGEKGRGKKGQRPELEAKFGYDTKAGMHALRLLYECKELMETGVITLPRPERDLLVKVRQGAWSIEKLLDEANRLFRDVEAAAQKSQLPESVDREAVSHLISGAYLRHWGRA